MSVNTFVRRYLDGIASPRPMDEDNRREYCVNLFEALYDNRFGPYHQIGRIMRSVRCDDHLDLSRFRHNTIRHIMAEAEDDTGLLLTRLIDNNLTYDNEVMIMQVLKQHRWPMNLKLGIYLFINRVVSVFTK